MTEQLRPEPGDRVLEIGTGSGYQAAVLARLVARVYSIEIVPELAERGAGDPRGARRRERRGASRATATAGCPITRPSTASSSPPRRRRCPSPSSTSSRSEAASSCRWAAATRSCASSSAPRRASAARRSSPCASSPSSAKAGKVCARASPAGRAFQLDHVAVRIADVHRRAHAEGAVAGADVAGRDAVRAQVSAERGLVEARELQADVVDVATVGRRRAAAGAAEGRIHDDEVDQARAGAELDQAERVAAPLLAAAERAAVEGEGALEIGHAKHDVVEAEDLDRAHGLTAPASSLAREGRRRLRSRGRSRRA